MLRDLSSKVLTAGSADAALRMLERQDRIDLLFTDVIMPGSVGATDLAARARDCGTRVSAYCSRPAIRKTRSCITTGWTRA